MNIDKFGRHLIVGVTHQTNIDKFGRHISNFNREAQVTGSNLFPLTDDGQYDVEDKRLCNVQLPVDNTDGANKAYVDKTLEEIHTVIQKASSSKLNVTTTVRDLHHLKMRIDKLENDQGFTIQQIVEDVEDIKKTLHKHKNQLSDLSILERTVKVELDAVELKRYTTDTQLRQDLKQLTVGYDKDIENLHRKLKALETSMQP